MYMLLCTVDLLYKQNRDFVTYLQNTFKLVTFEVVIFQVEADEDNSWAFIAKSVVYCRTDVQALATNNGS